MANSRFIQISSYCLAEYEFWDGIPTTLDVIEEDFVVVHNSTNNTNQIYNKDVAQNTTMNIQDVTVIPAENSRLIEEDSENVPIYSAYNDDLSTTEIDSKNVPYDIVRFHFPTGYNFTEQEALVLSVRQRQNNGLEHIFCNILLDFASSDYLVKLNPFPLFITDAMYDRYVEIRIPSIKWINQEYYNPAYTTANTLGATMTPKTDGGFTGFIDNSPIRIVLQEANVADSLVNEDNELIEYSAWRVEEAFEATVPQISEFDNMGAVIQEATDGNYILYYASVNGAFPEDLIGDLTARNPNDDWIIVHQLNVYEQIGSNFVNTLKTIDVQDSDFDEPRTFRPVLKNSSIAVSFSIDYLMRLLNRRNGEQIIKRGSFTSIEPKKYGRQIQPIQLDGPPRSQKIYNKIVRTNIDHTRLFVEPTLDSVNTPIAQFNNEQMREKNVYVPVFFNFNRVGVSDRSYSISGDTQKQNLIYRQMGLHMLITPFDNQFKFKVYQIKDDVPTPMNLDLSSNFRLVFMNNNEKVVIDNIKDSSMENLQEGEVSFLLPKDKAEIIMGSTDRTFYLTAVAEDNTETVLYTGFWNKSTEREQIDAAITEAQDEVSSDTETATSETTQLDENSSAGLDIPGHVSEKATSRAETSNVLRINPDEDTIEPQG